MGSFRNKSGYGSGLIGMGKTGGRVGKKLPDHAIRASAKRAAKLTTKSDAKAAGFKRRAAGIETLEAKSLIQSEYTDVKKEHDKSAHAKKLNISVDELERRILALKRHYTSISSE